MMIHSRHVSCQKRLTTMDGVCPMTVSYTHLTGAIVGIVVVAVLAIGAIVGVIISKKRKK